MIPSPVPEGLRMSDVSVEQWREYVFKDGTIYHIDSPQRVYIKSKQNGDSHRVVDADGITHYIPDGWKALRWRNHPDQPEVLF